MQYINEHSKVHRNNITINFTIDNTVSESTAGERTLRIMSKRVAEGYDAFIGPGLMLCRYQARLAAAFQKPIIGYVSLVYLSISSPV